MTLFSISRPSRKLAVLAALGALVLGGVALAQEPPPPPKYEAVDANGVDLLSGSISVSQPVNSIGGDGAGGLRASEVIRFGQPLSSQYSYVLLTREGEFGDSFHTTVVLLGQTETFEGTPSTGAMPDSFTSGQIYVEGTDLVYIQKDGTIARFQKVTLGTTGPARRVGYLKSVVFPSGERLTVDFVYGGNMLIESSLGYAMTGSIFGSRWSPVAANLTQGGCAGATCSGPTFTYQAALGRSLTSSVSGVTLTLANPAGGAARTYVVDSDSRVTSFSNGAGTWTYAYSEDLDAWDPQDGVRTTTATDPLGNKRVVKTRMSSQHILSDTVGIKPDGTSGQTTTFQYSADAVRSGLGLLTQITWPEGNRNRYEYDDYYNVKKKWTDPKSGPGPTSTLVEASYNLGLCSSVLRVCNRPDWIKDERGSQTDFTYDSTHGGVLTVTKPAGPNGVRPQTRYTYGQFTARYYKAGVLTAAPPVWRLTQTSTCMALASCAGTADEVLTTYAYEDSAVANNVRFLSTTTRAGNVAAAAGATTTYTYNARGDVVATDGPLPGAEDVVQAYYDPSRWKVGEVGPDPDGAGGMLYRASKTRYRADGQPDASLIGVVADRSEATFINAFQVLQASETIYDAQARAIRTVQKGLSGSSLVVTGVSDQAYDAAGRPNCNTVRMNPATFSAMLGACAVGIPGTDGPDRITVTEYDAAGRVADVVTGYLSGSQRVEKVITYTANGQEATVADGKGNQTTYEYDGFDRLVKVRYPNAVGTGSSPTDYEEYGYDAAGNRTSWRRRDGTTAAFTYDALNRVQNGLRGEAYTYDNLSRRISATHNGASASATYDALGRMTGETTNGLAMTYQYDLAGRRTRMTWPDGFYLNYEYYYDGAMSGLRDVGGSYLYTRTYDGLGRATATYRNNGVHTAYGYDSASRLSSLSHDLAGTDRDQTWTFGYNAAGQVKSRTASNSVYEWAESQGTKSYTLNGLNQYSTAAGLTIAYDARGNLQNDGTKSYGYDLINNLVSTSTGVTLGYEPTGRLWSVTAATPTIFLYSGSDLVAEYNGVGALVRRYVPGPGTDAPIVWYEGAGVADRRFLLDDPQGSIVGVTNSAGVSVFTNTYDEYGIPAAGNQGRFQYTGQAWLPEVGLYHYKARAYSPTLGRFLQTDPIGYGDGLNWYAYVGNDPLNKTDPEGKQAFGFCAYCEKGSVTPSEPPKYVTTYTKAEINAVGGVGGKAGGGTYETRTAADGKVVEAGGYVRASINAGWDIGAGGGAEVEMSSQKPSTGVSWGADASAMGASVALQPGSTTVGYGVGPSASPVTGTVGMEAKVMVPDNSDSLAGRIRQGAENFSVGVKTEIGRALCTISVCP